MPKIFGVSEQLPCNKNTRMVSHETFGCTVASTCPSFVAPSSVHLLTSQRDGTHKFLRARDAHLLPDYFGSDPTTSTWPSLSSRMYLNRVPSLYVHIRTSTQRRCGRSLHSPTYIAGRYPPFSLFSLDETLTEVGLELRHDPRPPASSSRQPSPTEGRQWAVWAQWAYASLQSTPEILHRRLLFLSLIHNDPNDAPIFETRHLSLSRSPTTQPSDCLRHHRLFSSSASVPRNVLHLHLSLPLTPSTSPSHQRGNPLLGPNTFTWSSNLPLSPPSPLASRVSSRPRAAFKQFAWLPLQYTSFKYGRWDTHGCFRPQVDYSRCDWVIIGFNSLPIDRFLLSFVRCRCICENFIAVILTLKNDVKRVRR